MHIGVENKGREYSYSLGSGFIGLVEAPEPLRPPLTISRIFLQQ